METIKHTHFLALHCAKGDVPTTFTWGGRRDSDPQHPAPQAGTLPLSYDHQVKLHFTMTVSICARISEDV